MENYTEVPVPDHYPTWMVMRWCAMTFDPRGKIRPHKLAWYSTETEYEETVTDSSLNLMVRRRYRTSVHFKDPQNATLFRLRWP